MRRLAFLLPAFVALGFAATAAQAQTVKVAIGGDLEREARELGEREVRDQADRLAQVVTEELRDRGVLAGAQIDLTLTDLKPNRPTFNQVASRPGLDPFHSRSIGGATIEGEILTADGQRIPVRYDWYSGSLADVLGYNTWQDAERTFERFADNLAEGRYVTR